MILALLIGIGVIWMMIPKNKLSAGEQVVVRNVGVGVKTFLWSNVLLWGGLILWAGAREPTPTHVQSHVQAPKTAPTTPHVQAPKTARVRVIPHPSGKDEWNAQNYRAYGNRWTWGE